MPADGCCVGHGASLGVSRSESWSSLLATVVELDWPVHLFPANWVSGTEVVVVVGEAGIPMSSPVAPPITTRHAI